MGISKFAESGKFFRFIAVGILNTAVSFGLFLVFFHLFGFHYLVANATVFISWVWFGYQLQRTLAFRVPKSKDGFKKFLLNQLLFIGVSSFSMWLVVELGGVEPEIAWLITVGLVTLGMYVVSRLWVFN